MFIQFSLLVPTETSKHLNNHIPKKWAGEEPKPFKPDLPRSVSLKNYINHAIGVPASNNATKHKPN